MPDFRFGVISGHFARRRPCSLCPESRRPAEGAARNAVPVIKIATPRALEDRDPRPGAAFHEVGDGPHQRIEPIGRSRPMRARRCRSRTSHLPAPRSAADVLHPALLVEHRDRLGAQPFAARCMHRTSPAPGDRFAQHGPHHVAALVDLSDQRVGLKPPIQRHRLASPSPAAPSPRRVASAST